MKRSHPCGDSKPLGHSLMTECVFLFPERWWATRSPPPAAAFPSSRTPKPFARIQLHFHVLSSVSQNYPPQTPLMCSLMKTLAYRCCWKHLFQDWLYSVHDSEVLTHSGQSDVSAIPGLPPWQGAELVDSTRRVEGGCRPSSYLAAWTLNSLSSLEARPPVHIPVSLLGPQL